MSDNINEIITAQNRLAIKVKNIFTKCATKTQLQRLEDYYIFQSNYGKALKCNNYDPSLQWFTSTFVNDGANYYYENKGQFVKILVYSE